MHDPRVIAAMMAEKRRRRWERIVHLRRQAETRNSGEPLDHGYWALVHDLEHASPTTNLKQLAEIGIEPLDPVCLEEQTLATELEVIIEGLAVLEVYLLHTDHLDDRELYEMLHRRLLRETVRDVPTGVGVREWLDLAGGIDSEIWYRFHASDDQRAEASRRGVIVPERGIAKVDRDRRLPRPPRPASIAE